MADNTTTGNAGFTLPNPTQAAPTGGVSLQVQNAPVVMPIEDTSSRDLLIGGGVLLVLFIAFFFAKNGYANSLVAKRVQPNRANTAAWWLFVMLCSLSTGVVLAAVSASRFMTPFIVGPLAAVGLVSFVLMVLMSRK